MKTILIVEDNAKEGLLYEQALNDEGYRVLWAYDGEEALRLADIEQLDLVVLDINLPGVNGMDVLGKMLACQPQLPIILNSAYGGYKDDFMSWAANAYLVKSGDLTELVSRVQEMLAPAP